MICATAVETRLNSAAWIVTVLMFVSSIDIVDGSEASFLQLYAHTNEKITDRWVRRFGRCNRRLPGERRVVEESCLPSAALTSIEPIEISQGRTFNHRLSWTLIGRRVHSPPQHRDDFFRSSLLLSSSRAPDTLCQAGTWQALQ
jgi:hypothetical protein